MSDPINSDSLTRAKDRALRLLGVRNRSEFEIRTRLEKAGFTGDVIAEVVSWLVSLNYLDDERFAAEWVESRLRHKPLGRSRLAYELGQKGIDREVVERVLEGVDLQKESELAINLASKQFARMRETSWERVERKIYGYLSRRGFRSDAVRRAIESVRERME